MNQFEQTRDAFVEALVEIFFKMLEQIKENTKRLEKQDKPLEIEKEEYQPEQEKDNEIEKEYLLLETDEVLKLESGNEHYKNELAVIKINEDELIKINKDELSPYAKELIEYMNDNPELAKQLIMKMSEYYLDNRVENLKQELENLYFKFNEYKQSVNPRNMEDRKLLNNIILLESKIAEKEEKMKLNTAQNKNQIAERKKDEYKNIEKHSIPYMLKELERKGYDISKLKNENDVIKQFGILQRKEEQLEGNIEIDRTEKETKIEIEEELEIS